MLFRQSRRHAIDTFVADWTYFARAPIQIIIHVHLVCSSNYDNCPIVVGLCMNTYYIREWCEHAHRMVDGMYRFFVVLIPIQWFCSNNNGINSRMHCENVDLWCNKWHYESMIWWSQSMRLYKMNAYSPQPLHDRTIQWRMATKMPQI